MPSKKNTQKRLGIFYRSNGRWTGPYAGVTFTPYTWNRNPRKQDLREIANHVLKSQVRLLPVG
jgi:hypothetical protein